MKILCFGDSNTYGYIPGGGRYDKHTRWPGRLQGFLGEQYRVIEAGLNGRTTIFDDMLCPGRCGLDDIGVDVELHSPLDLLIIMLGTNDCKTQFHTSARAIAEGLESVLKRAETSSAGPFKVLVIAPAPLGDEAAHADFGMEFNETSIKISKELSEEYAKVADELGYEFLDAANVTAVSSADGVHLDEAGHEALALAVFRYMNEGRWL